MSITIPGLPEGVECVKIGIAGPEDFEIYDGLIIKGKREGTTSQLIVRPAAGYEFIESPSGTRRLYPAGYDIVKRLDPPEVLKFELEFKVTNSLQKQRVQAAVSALTDLAGFMSLDPEPVDRSGWEPPVKHFDAIVEKTRL